MPQFVFAIEQGLDTMVHHFEEPADRQGGIAIAHYHTRQQYRLRHQFMKDEAAAQSGIESGKGTVARV